MSGALPAMIASQTKSIDCKQHRALKLDRNKSSFLVDLFFSARLAGRSRRAYRLLSVIPA